MIFGRETLRLLTSGVRGLNVTLPHKQAAAELVNELTPRAARAQAVNTIAFFEDTTLLGDNTDGIGLISDLERNLQIDLADKRVLILGAGGAARGVIGPLLERELRSLAIANRTPFKARKLAAEFSDMGANRRLHLRRDQGPAYDLIINATSGEPAGRDAGIARRVGRRRHRLLRHGLRPRSTPFTLWAGTHHAGLISKGWGMLVEQAAESFLLWRGIRPNTQPVLEAFAQND